MLFGLPVEALEAMVVSGLTLLWTRLSEVFENDEDQPEESYVLGRAVTSWEWEQAISELIDAGHYPVPVYSTVAYEIEDIHRALIAGEPGLFDQATPQMAEYVLYHSRFVRHWKRTNIFR